MTVNTNTIADEAGTGGPDFVGMPTVAGDPVVESGSNSDGEWTKWADGTQLCAGELASAPASGWSAGTNISFIDSGAKAFPMNFLAEPTVTARCDDGQISARSSYIGRANSTSTGFTESWYVSAAPESSYSSGVTAVYIAIGRWK